MNANFGEYTLISSLQNQFKTSNIIFDIIFGLILAKLIQSLFSYSIIDIIHKLCSIKNFEFFNKGKVVIVCTPNTAVDDKKFVILETLNDMIKKNISTINSIYYENTGKNLILRGIDKTILSDDIYISIHSEDIDRKKDELLVVRITVYTITLTSHKYSSIDIEKKIDEWIINWEKNKEHKHIQITSDLYSAKDFKSFKTFDNLFFDGKDILIKTLNRFKNNEELYKKIGRPYTLGILLYGEPGCGKTSVLKAIANYMQLDVHSVNIKNFKDTDSFMDCWYQSLKTNSWNSNALQQKIIHLPEIDYLCEEFLKDDAKTKDNNDNIKKQDNNIVINVNKHDIDDDECKKNKCGLNKSFFRELFDGIDEQYGRIIVMDTNNPDKLDPIMIRDGRIDIKLQFDKMSYQNMKLYIEHIYDTKLSDDIILPDRKFRVVKIQSIIESCMNDELSISDCVDKINCAEIDEDEIDKL